VDILVDSGPLVCGGGPRRAALVVERAGWQGNIPPITDVCSDVLRKIGEVLRFESASGPHEHRQRRTM